MVFIKVELEKMERKGDIEERIERGMSEALLSGRRKIINNTSSQLAIVGSNICPIQSLDYE